MMPKPKVLIPFLRHRIRIVLPLIVLFLLLTSLEVSASTEPATGATLPIQEEPIPAEPSADETVVIDAVIYLVPLPWKGKKVVPPADTVPNLQKIPLDLTLNQTEIHLRREMIEPLKAMAAAAKEDGVSLLVDSGYRSVRYQRTIYRQFLEKGRSFQSIARYIAPPGYSEHVLGTVVDFVPSSHGFAKTATYSWLKQHAAKFGFYEALPRHSRAKKPWEPWHWKYRLESTPPLSAPATTVVQEIPGENPSIPAAIKDTPNQLELR